MEKESEKSLDVRSLAEMPAQSENIAFRADEMLGCAKCGRANPPNRLSCLYCATQIELPEERKHQVKLNLRPLENWEKGFNIILLPPANESDAEGISRYLSIDPDVLQQMLSAMQPVPIARIESEAEAEIAVRQLKKFGLAAGVVSDEVLRADKLPTRLREIEFRERSIVVTSFNTGDKIEIGRDELVLIVAGVVINLKTESVEKPKKKGTKLHQETETASDEKLIDIYSEGNADGFRISTNGFDFSCLGGEKDLRAAVNIDLLKAKLIRFAPDARLADEYRASLNTLSTVWEIDRQKDFRGFTRTGIGRSGFAKVERTSNLTQFTKYSRLQRHLL